jgi:arsenical pump membrane protein
MLSADAVPHPRALLIGLNVGPNLAVTGSLSAFLWLQTARAAGAQPSIRGYTRLGALVAPAGIAGALLALYLLSPSRV